jgi:hypothetical protein
MIQGPSLLNLHEWGVPKDVRRMIVKRMDCLSYEVAKLAHDKGHERERAHAIPDVCATAAYGGHLELLKWARANGCDWDSRTCEDAALEGHLEVLQWARANGCPWDAVTCQCAAGGGHLEVLQWARANGCPCNSYKQDNASLN